MDFFKSQLDRIQQQLAGLNASQKMLVACLVVIIVMTVELGLIHPPVGMVVFVIKSVIQDINFSTIFAGVLPFIATDLIRLVILIAFPAIALWLPSRM